MLSDEVDSTHNLHKRRHQIRYNSYYRRYSRAFVRSTLQSDHFLAPIRACTGYNFRILILVKQTEWSPAFPKFQPLQLQPPIIYAKAPQPHPFSVHRILNFILHDITTAVYHVTHVSATEQLSIVKQ